MEQSMASLIRNINDALRLDNSGNDKEAYMKYLDCILCITCNLQQRVRDKGGDVIITKDVSKQVMLAQQCIERVSVIVNKIGLVQLRMVLQSEESRPNQSRPFLHVPPLPLLEPATNSFARSEGIMPMEVAYKRNQQLMDAYRARISRMNKRDPGAYNLSLSIQRKIAENLAIAQKAEEALAKKMKERQQRLEEEAERRFTASAGMSKEEQEQRQIYKKILEYEQDAKWLQNWRIKLESTPSEPEVICQLIQEILRCRDHPLTLLIKEYQRRVYEKLYPIVANKKERLAAVKVPLDPVLWPAETSDLGVKDCGRPKSRERDSEDENVTRENVSTHYQVRIKNESEEGEHLDTSGTFHHPLENKEVKCTASFVPDREESKECFSNKNKEAEKSSDDGDKRFGDSDPSAGDTDQNVTPMQEQTRMETCPQDLQKQKLLDAERMAENPDSKDFLKNMDPSQSQNAEAGRNPADFVSVVTGGENTEKEGELIETMLNDGNSISAAVFAEETQTQLELAIEKGEKLQSHLTKDQANSVRILRRISDYEKYNAENMDDLFDDEDEGEEMCISSDQTKGRSGSEFDSNHPSSIDSASLRGSDSLVSRSSSGGSMQDLGALGEGRREELEQMSKEAYARHVKNIAEDVHNYIEKLLVLFTIAYEQLDCPLGRDQCYASLEETFFKPIWKYLLMLFRLSNYKEEITLAHKMTLKADIHPLDIGVSAKLCLQQSAGSMNTSPYQQAITQLSCIKDHYTMLSKLECIVKTVHLVCDCVKDFYKSQGFKASDIPSVGADDLLPVISFIVIKSQLPQLVSECQAMAEFIHEGYIMGQEGYCLTTLETAISYLVTSDLNRPCSPT